MYDLTQDYPKIKTALSEEFARFAEAFDEYGIFDANYPDDTISEIASKSYDGYIAHTNGGLRCMVMNDLRSVESSGLHGDSFESNILQPYIDRGYVDAAEEYLRQSEDAELCEAWENDMQMSADEFVFDYWDKIKTEYETYHKMQASFPGFELPVWHLSKRGIEIDDELEKISDFFGDWLTEGSTFWYEARAIFYDTDNFRNISGKPELYIFAGINTDFEYGREKGLDTSFERTIPLDRLTPKRLTVIVDAMIDSITHDATTRS